MDVENVTEPEEFGPRYPVMEGVEGSELGDEDDFDRPPVEHMTPVPR